MTALLKYDAACRAISEAKTVDEVSEWIDKAAAVREYGRRIKNRQLEIDAIEIRVKAKRRRGELLLEYKAAGRIRDGKPSLANDGLPQITLEELEVTPNESSEEQKIALIEGSSFDRLVARCRAYAEAHPQKHSFDVLRPPPEGGPINGSRNIMGSRQEPDDSLDYFPTPPWATRALMEHVLPALGVRKFKSAWEPACGEGHIAEVLCEYFSEVLASDIFDYGFGEQHEKWEQIDFLTYSKEGHPVADWLITNPPFDDKAVQFVLRALDLSKVGVAMFFRLQWIPTKGRYEKLFRDFPPTLVSFFTERVPLVKGRWDPTATTATDYIWLVWKHGEKPRAPLWIPPGQRKALTRPDDAERFTTQPVTKKDHIICDEPFDAQTGEIAAEPSPIAVITPETERSQVSPEPNPDLDIPNFLKIGDPNNFRNGERNT